MRYSPRFGGSDPFDVTPSRPRAFAAGNRCLVLGGGLLGSHVTLRLHASGHAVTVMSRSFNPMLLDAAPSASLRRLSARIDAGPDLEREVEAADVVFFCAGTSTPGLSARSAAASVQGSLVPALTVLDAMRRTSTARIVIASSGGTVYGKTSRLPTPEDEPTRPISIHGLNALTIESFAQHFRNELGLDPVVLRYANLYGPGQLAQRDQGVIAAWCRAILRGEPIVLYGNGDVRRDFLYTEDAAIATHRIAMEPGATGVYNVGSGRSHSLREILDVLLDVVDRPIKVRQEPSRPIDVPVTQLDCGRLRECISWMPETALADGVAASWAWCRSEHEGEGAGGTAAHGRRGDASSAATTTT